MFGLILHFAIVLALAKSISSTFEFYKAAVVYVVLDLVLGLIFGGYANITQIVIIGLIKLLVALAYFYLLDRSEDTIFTWLIVFAVGFFVLLAI